MCLRDLIPQTVQPCVSGLAGSPLSHESKDKIRDVLSSILASALKYNYLVRNPVEGVIPPRPKGSRRNKPFLRPEQFAALVEVIPEPYASMVYVAVLTGLRVSGWLVGQVLQI